MERLVTFAIGADPPPRLDRALARDVPPEQELSRSRLVRLVAEGAVRVNGAPVLSATARVIAGDRIEIRVPTPADSRIEGEAIPLSILHEDADIILINKPAGMVIHPAPGSPSGTLVNALIAHCGTSLSGVGGERRPGIVHRLDKDTSGLVVVAKNDRAHHALAAQFAAHTVERHYLAVCHGAPSAGDPRLRGLRGVTAEAGGVLRIATGMARHRHDRQRQAVTDGGRPAITRLRVDAAFADQAALVSCWLETGRTHQIRVHLAHVGHALIGDSVYGGRRRLSPRMPEVARDFPRQALHAATLGFHHPASGAALTFTAPLPDDMSDLLTALRGAI